MLSPLAALPLHLACQLLVGEDIHSSNVTLATAASAYPKLATELPDGYGVFHEVGVAYKNYKNEIRWDQARKICVADGGYLAAIDSFKKVEIIKSIADNGAYTWVGYHRLFDVTEWTDVKTGSPAVTLPWRRDTWTYDLNRRCLALWADGSGLYSISCDELHSFVCEIPIFKD